MINLYKTKSLNFITRKISILRNKKDIAKHYCRRQQLFCNFISIWLKMYKPFLMSFYNCIALKIAYYKDMEIAAHTALSFKVWSVNSIVAVWKKQGDLFHEPRFSGPVERWQSRYKECHLLDLINVQCACQHFSRLNNSLLYFGLVFLPVFGTSFLKHSIGGRLYNSIFRSSQKIERLKWFETLLFPRLTIYWNSQK